MYIFWKSKSFLLNFDLAKLQDLYLKFYIKKQTKQMNYLKRSSIYHLSEKNKRYTIKKVV